MSQGGILSDVTTPGADIETITGNTGGAVPPNGAHTIFLVGSGGVTVTGDIGTNTLTITDATSFAYQNVTTSPYVVSGTDEFLSVDTSTIPITIQLPNSPGTGVFYIVKDRIGNSGTNNITVTTVGGVVTIDGAATFPMSSNFMSANFLFNGTTYEVW